MAAGVAAGLAVGIGFVVLLATLMPAGQLYGTSRAFPDQYYYPHPLVRIDGVKEAYAVGERVDFAVSLKDDCAFPEIVAVVDVKTKEILWDFNATREGVFKLCSTFGSDGPPEFSPAWNLRNYLDRLTIDQPGHYAVVVKHGHAAVQKGFTVG